jgi:hypothetical protein
MFRVVAVLGLFACGYPQPHSHAGEDASAGDGTVPGGSQCESRSGTRLKLHGYQHADGFDPRSLYDARFNWSCRYQLAVDGKLRCIPDDPNHLHGDLAFSDAACTTAIAAIFGPLYKTMTPFVGVDGGLTFSDPS